MKRITLFVFLLILSLINFAQDRNQLSYEIIEQITESLAEDYSDEVDLTEVIEDLERLLENPININNTSQLELEQIPFLTSFQIDKILVYQKQVGQIYSVYELLAIEGINQEQLNYLQPFIAFLPPDIETKTYLKQELNLRYSQNIEEAAGFVSDDGLEAPNFSGIKPALLMKYKAQKGNKLFWGLTAENDSGEDFFSGSNQSGFDFYSGFFGYHGKGILKQVYVGDYQVKTGQGLIQWTNYGVRKSTEALSIRQKGQGLKASSSTDENRHLRGAAATFSIGNLDLLTYYSNLNVDANIVTTDEDGLTTLVSSRQTSGYHRTNNEIYDENALNTQKAGANLKLRMRRFSIGVNGLYETLDAPLDSITQLYGIHRFHGKNNYNVSTDFLWVQNKFNVFGEAAYSKSGGKALLSGIEAQPVNEMSFSVLYRNYEKNFHSINGTSFGESSSNINEKGIYAGISIYPVSHVKITGYLDAYQTHWMKFTTVTPVKGTDISLQTDYSPTRNLNMYLRFKTESNFEKNKTDLALRKDIEQTTTKVRYQIAWSPSDKIKFRLRTEYTQYSKADSIEHGFLVFGDVVAKPIEKFTGTARLAWFNTDGYDSRVYAYENDVPQYFYVPAFNGTGLRYYLILKYELMESLTLYAKASQTRFFNAAGIGTGNSNYNTSQLTQVKVHLKFRF